MRVRSQRLLFTRILGLSAATSLSAWVAPALAQVAEKRVAEPAQFTFSSVECPDPKAVQLAVLSLIPPEHYVRLEHGVRIELEDLGESYRVTVSKDGATVKKRYSDPARDCEGRARFAAVFAVLTLMPPELGLAALPQAEPEAEPKPTAPPAAPPPLGPTLESTMPARPPLVHIELSALYAYAPPILEAPSLHTFGAELRVAVGRGAISGTLSLAYTQRAQFDLASVQGEITRLPLSVGARLRTDFSAWSLAAELGLLLVPERVRATNLLSEHTASALDVGVRAGVQLERKIGPHFAPFVGAFVWLSPAPSEISALPEGVLGNLPYLWLGGAVGVSFGL
jgi:hypothetical protein